MIRNRKLPAGRFNNSYAPRVGVAVMSLAAFELARGAQPAPEAPQVMQGISVTEEIFEDGYKVDKASSDKFTQSVIDTPQTITIISKELMQDRGAATLSDALRNSPGITFTLGENGNTTTGDAVFMRGFDTSSSIFADGIRDLGTVSRDVFNTEQVEIVKGPSGSDNGRSTPTGYLNMASKVPTLQNATSGSLTGGSEGRGRFTFDLNHGVGGNAAGAAVRFNAMYDKGDKLGRDVAMNKRWGIAPSFAIGLGSATRAYIYYQHVEQNNIPDGGISAVGQPGYTNPLLGTTVAEPVDSSNFYGSKDDYDDVKADMLTVRFEHDLSANTTLRNISRYGRTTEQYVLTGINAIVVPYPADPATWLGTRSRQAKDQENQILTNQTGIVTVFLTGAFQQDLSTGIEILYESQSNVAFIPSGTTTLANLYNPSTSDVFAPMVPSGAHTAGDTTTAALYGFDTLHLGQKWLLSAGIRFEHYMTDFTSLPASTVTPQTASVLSDSANLLSGKLGLVYKPLPNGSIYAAVATSQLPPGGTNFTLNAPTPNATTGVVGINAPNLDPQKATTMEVGTKWELLENRLVVMAAAFDTTNKNDQAISDPATGAIDQYGERNVRGLEFGASGMLTAAWQVSAGLSLMHTQVTQAAVTQPGQAGAGINFSPDVSFTAWTSYRFPIGLTVGGGAQYVSTQATAINNGSVPVTFFPEIPSYWVFDAMAAYDFNPKVSLQLNVNNVTDEDYISAVNNGRSRYSLGTPAAAQLTVNFRF
ncbi:MAG: catecholate siderophore receptor Fiu [Pseudomonadota bacterium]